jgi:hypothetical protein
LNLITAFEEAALYHHTEDISNLYTVTGRLDPSVVYFHKVLQLWSIVGGKTSLPTRDLRTGKLDNALTRFFRAVVDPVMRDDAPSDESIPDIVKRQKRFYGLPSSEEESAASTKDAPVQGKRDKLRKIGELVPFAHRISTGAYPCSAIHRRANSHGRNQ